MTENIWLALIICGSLVSVVGILTTVITMGAYSREIEEAWRAWRKSRGE